MYASEALKKLRAGNEVLWEELDSIQPWLQNHYKQEARHEFDWFMANNGDIDRLPFPHAREENRPGNENYYQPEKLLTTVTTEANRIRLIPTRGESNPALRGNTPRKKKVLLEALARHHQHEAESVERE